MRNAIVAALALLTGTMQPVGVSAQSSGAPVLRDQGDCAPEHQRDGQCRAGQKFVETRVWIPAGDYVHETDPPCKSDRKALLDRIMQGIGTEGAKLSGPLAPLFGPMIADASGEVARSVEKSGGDLAKLLSQWHATDPSSTCRVIDVLLPAGATLAKIELVAREDGSAYDATGWHFCQVQELRCGELGWARFEDPMIKETGSRVWVGAIFKNWSDNRARRAAVRLWYWPLKQR